MRISVLLLLSLLLVPLVLSCMKKEKELEEKLNESLEVPFSVTKLFWEDCYRLDFDLTEDRAKFLKNPENVFSYIHSLAQKSFLYSEICQLYFQISDAKGLWFVGSILKENFIREKNTTHMFHEISFSEDLRNYACNFYKKHALERAFLVCTKHTELKKFFSNE